MGNIIISANASLDGVMQDPTGDEDFRAGGWFGHINDNDRQAWAGLGAQEAADAGALLLGRFSDAWFASRWRDRTGPWADRLNAMPKYVLSSTLKTPEWSNAAILSGDLTGEIAKLKSRIDGDIVVIGSVQLVQSLWTHDLADELRLKIFPVVLGGGRRLFPESGETKPMRLKTATPLGDNLSYLIYERAR